MPFMLIRTFTEGYKSTIAFLDRISFYLAAFLGKEGTSFVLHLLILSSNSCHLSVITVFPKPVIKLADRQSQIKTQAIEERREVDILS